MLNIIAAASASFLALINDPAEARFCVAAAEAREIRESAKNGGDEFLAMVASRTAETWRGHLAKLAPDDAALEAMRRSLVDNRAEHYRYGDCSDLALMAGSDGDLAAAARKFDESGVRPAQEEDIEELDLAEVPIMQTLQPAGSELVVMPGLHNRVACYALLANIIAGMPPKAKERPAFEAGLAKLERDWSMNLNAAADYKEELRAATAGFDSAGFEALSEPEGEARISYCFGLAGIE